MSLAVRAASAPVAAAVASGRCRRGRVLCQASHTEEKKPKQGLLGQLRELGPIGLTIGKDIHLDEAPVAKEPKQQAKKTAEGAAQMVQRAADAAGVSLGPIGLTIGSDLKNISLDEEEGSSSNGSEPSTRPKSYASLTTAEWRELYEKEGAVDLWVQEEFNSGSRLVGGSAVYRGGVAGQGSGEGPGASSAQSFKVKIINHYAEEEVDVEVPEDRYILWAAEEQGYELPYACRLGCCTSCTVKVKEGEMFQPHSLGLSKSLRDQGYALMCVGYPLSDLVLETVPEDEAYELQFGQTFAERAVDPNAPSVERDDFAIELAMLDE